MKTVLKKWGNSMGLRIPKAFIKHLNIEEGEELEVEIKKNQILLRKSPESLGALIEKISPENLHEETKTGNILGKEIW